MTTWERIELAPMDGTRLLLFEPNFGEVVGAYGARGDKPESWYACVPMGPWLNPTHFQRLPAAPTFAPAPLPTPRD